MKKFFAALVAAALIFTVQPASAVIYDRQVSEEDDSNGTSGSGVFDATKVEFALDSEDPDRYLFWVYTNGVIKSKSFNDGRGSWAGIFIDVDGDDEEDYMLATSDNNLVANDGIDIDLFDIVADEYRSDCNAQFWSNLAESVNWVGFAVDSDCITSMGTFSIQGYVDFVADDSKNYDYAPDQYFEVTPGLEEVPIPEEDPELVAYEEAAAAVRSAELNNENYDTASDLVSALTDSDKKTALEERLEVVSNIIEARQALEEAEEDYSLYDTAKEAIDLLQEGSVKIAFSSRLLVVKKRLDAARLNALKAVANKKYANCAAMNKVLPGGIAKVAKFKNKGALLNYQPFVLASGYALNASLDRDKDGIACER